MYAAEEQKTYHKNTQHHVIIVDEKYQLLLALRKLCCHFQDEVLHFCLQLPQYTVDTLVRVVSTDANNCSREFCKSASNLSTRVNR